MEETASDGKTGIKATAIPLGDASAVGSATQQTPVRGDKIRPEIAIGATGNGRPLSPKELGKIADKLETLLTALEGAGPRAGLDRPPDGRGRFQDPSVGRDINDRFNITGTRIPTPGNITRTHEPGPMPDNNPLGGLTAQELFARQRGETSPGKDLSGAININKNAPRTGWDERGWSYTYNSGTNTYTGSTSYTIQGGKTAVDGFHFGKSGGPLIEVTTFTYETGNQEAEIAYYDLDGKEIG